VQNPISGGFLTNGSGAGEESEVRKKLLEIDKTCSQQDMEGAKRHQLLVHNGEMLFKSLNSVTNAEKRIQGIIHGAQITFKSILIWNWLLISMGIVMFSAAIYSAVALVRWDVTGVLALTGFGDILSVFKFSMDRTQRSLGDQVQVETAYEGYIKQIMKFDEHFASDWGIQNIREINEEIRRATVYSMELVQDFTEIAKPLQEKPWITALPIRYDKLNITADKDANEDTVVYVGKDFTISGAIRNVSDKSVSINCVVIAVRPPFATPDGGPFRWDFLFEGNVGTLKPGEVHQVKRTKRIEQNSSKLNKIEEIPDKLLGKDWYAFMTCQTEDGYWHDDNNKYWFEVKKTEPKQAMEPEKPAQVKQELLQKKPKKTEKAKKEKKQP
jgi:hypothetical protein